MAGNFIIRDCPHSRGITNRHPQKHTIARPGEPWYCCDCGTARPNPNGCQHMHVDNDTGKCSACDERMQSVEIETNFVTTGGPNAAGCKDPGCLASIEAGGDPLPSCSNPAGIYVPSGPLREVPISHTYRYTCNRCGCGGTLTADGFIGSCGESHYGDEVSARDTEGATL